MNTWAPSFAKRAATARPMPLLPPVTTATSPFNFDMVRPPVEGEGDLWRSRIAGHAAFGNAALQIMQRLARLATSLFLSAEDMQRMLLPSRARKKKYAVHARRP